MPTSVPSYEPTTLKPTSEPNIDGDLSDEDEDEHDEAEMFHVQMHQAINAM